MLSTDFLPLAHCADPGGPSPWTMLFQLIEETEKIQTLDHLLTQSALAFGAQGCGIVRFGSEGDAPLFYFPQELGPPYPWEETETEGALAGRSHSWWLAPFVAANKRWFLFLKGPKDPGHLFAFKIFSSTLLQKAEGSTALWAKVFQRAILEISLDQSLRLSSRLAHDFGNILTGILGFGELSLSQAPENSLQRGYLTEVVQSARQGARWVQKLQAAGRRMESPTQRTSLEKVIGEEALNWNRSLTPTQRILLPDTGSLPPVTMEESALRQVLGFVVENAREALFPEGSIHLTVRTLHLGPRECLETLGNTRPGDHVELTVADTGRGFPWEQQLRSFSELFSSSKGKRRGFGLALALGLLTNHHAGLAFESHHPQGTRTRILIPLAASG